MLKERGLLLNSVSIRLSQSHVESMVGWFTRPSQPQKREAQRQFAAMKERLEGILRIIPHVDDPELEVKSDKVCEALGTFVEEF